MAFVNYSLIEDLGEVIFPLLDSAYCLRYNGATFGQGL